MTDFLEILAQAELPDMGFEPNEWGGVISPKLGAVLGVGIGIWIVVGLIFAVWGYWWGFFKAQRR